MQTQERDTETQPVYSPEELTLASIDLLRAVEASAALNDQLTNRVLQIERYLAETSAPSEATDQPQENALTGPQLGYLNAHQSFLDAHADIKSQAEPRDLRAIEAVANMAAAAMRQAERAYDELRSHASWPTETVPDHVLAKHAPMIEGTEQPEIRVRIAHVHTLKEGWRCNETTAEWTGRGLKPDRYLLRAAMQVAFDEGRDEADRRNHPEAEPEFEEIAAVAS